MTTAEPVRVAVLGCGAIGSLYAAHLARLRGVEVWAVDPWPSTSRRSEDHGLQVTGQADFVAPVHAVTDAAALPQCAFGLVATKALHTRAAVGRGARAGRCRGGEPAERIGNEEVVAEVLPRVVRGSIVTAGHVTGPGMVRYDGLLATPGWGPSSSSPRTRARSLAWRSCSPTAG